ncbi:hypothetical protein ACIP9C_17580 [Lysinibacillus sp. NPDC093210]|uniref:hypothetical protein n=1 Tax=Lysinibacillus sp. NPDC093210 TaxID=3364133 RepID=UPI00380562C2
MFLTLLDRHKEEQIVIGTHGNIMTLLLNYFDNNIGFAFWQDLQMPAIIRCDFQNKKMIEIKILQ